MNSPSGARVSTTSLSWQLMIRIEELEEELSIARQKYHENDQQNLS